MPTETTPIPKLPPFTPLVEHHIRILACSPYPHWFASCSCGELIRHPQGRFSSWGPEDSRPIGYTGNSDQHYAVEDAQTHLIKHRAMIHVKSSMERTVRVIPVLSKGRIEFPMGFHPKPGPRDHWQTCPECEVEHALGAPAAGGGIKCVTEGCHFWSYSGSNAPIKRSCPDCHEQTLYATSWNEPGIVACGNCPYSR